MNKRLVTGAEVVRLKRGGFVAVCSGLLDWLFTLARFSLSITKNGCKGVLKVQFYRNIKSLITNYIKFL